jgi:hypothetical protein
MALNEPAIRAEVARVLPAFQDSSDRELLAAIGSIPFNAEFQGVAAPDALPELGGPDFGLSRVGEWFVRTNEAVREVVCNNKDEFRDVITAENVTALVLLLLPAMGMIGGSAPPAAAIALAVFLLRIGLNEYCRGRARPAASAA